MKHHPYLMEQEPGRVQEPGRGHEREGQAPGPRQLDRGMDMTRDAHGTGTREGERGQKPD